MSRLSLFARVFLELLAVFGPFSLLFDAASGTVVYLRGSSGDGASVLVVGGGFGARRDALPYVTIFFLRSGAVKLEDMKAAMVHGGGGVVATLQKVTQTRIVSAEGLWQGGGVNVNFQTSKFAR